MMGTLATVLAKQKVFTRKGLYRAEVEGNIENVNGVFRITRIQVKNHLKIPEEQSEVARKAFYPIFISALQHRALTKPFSQQQKKRT